MPPQRRLSPLVGADASSAAAHPPLQRAVTERSGRRATWDKSLVAATGKFNRRNSTTSSVRRRVVEFWVVTHATDVEHPQASRSHLLLNLPAARGLGVSGATRGGVRNRSRIFAPPRSGRRSTPESSGGSGPILLIVDGAKIPGRSGSAVLVAPELVVELELLRVDAQRVRRPAGCNPGTQRAPWWRSRRG